MDNDVIVAIIGAVAIVGSALASYFGVRYSTKESLGRAIDILKIEIDNLRIEINKLTTLVERVHKLEERVSVLETMIKDR